MWRSRLSIIVAALIVALTGLSHDAIAQGKGGGKGKEGGNPHGGPPGKSGNGPGRSDKAPKNDNKVRGNPGNAHNDRGSSSVAKNNGRANNAGRARAGAVLSSAVIAKASSRGHGNDFRVEDVGDRVRILNRDGDPLLFISDDEARDIGRWRVGLQDNNVRGGAPAFCRSGAGHPVWGRQWCVDKGFGIGDYDDYRWGRTTDLGDWRYPQGTYQPTLTSTVLESILGRTAFNRLALHAIELGFLEPLTGRYVTQPNEPQMLFVNSGPYPVAELRDTNRDFRWDDLLVALLLNR
ncbi:MAG TPA: hypothetical protein VF042_05080 [Gemmatimonadaceae bacterium]